MKRLTVAILAGVMMLGNAVLAEEVYDDEILWEDETAETLGEEADFLRMLL